VRELLARVLERSPEETAALPGDTSLFGSGLSLDSFTGLELLTAIKEEFGVDIAAEDLNLDSLRTVATLVDYLSGQRDSSQISR
jgi:acyl carrier protein